MVDALDAAAGRGHGMVCTVIMPQVFMGPSRSAANYSGAPRAFTAADFDMPRHYRPRVNVVERPVGTGGGKGYQITGHHEIMIPLLAWGVASRMQMTSGVSE